MKPKIVQVYCEISPHKDLSAFIFGTPDAGAFTVLNRIERSLWEKLNAIYCDEATLLSLNLSDPEASWRYDFNSLITLIKSGYSIRLNNYLLEAPGTHELFFLKRDAKAITVSSPTE